jgi:hypothetical protein
MKKVLLTTAALALLATFIAPAQAAISIGSATVVNGLASISGKGAVPGATITWEGSAVATANRKNGGFSFYGAVPADCTGTLGDGASSVEVAVVGCTPVSAGAPAPVAKTGQTTLQASGDDGALQKGVATTGPRFTDNSNGTITDNLTGLIWLKQASCFGYLQWSAALTAVSTLASGTCGLTDGSTPGQWRLPNLRELQSLLDYGTYGPALPTGHPFVSFQASYYWSSTSYALFPADYAWLVNFYDGDVNGTGKSYNGYVIAVRGGS